MNRGNLKLGLFRRLLDIHYEAGDNDFIRGTIVTFKC